MSWLFSASNSGLRINLNEIVINRVIFKNPENRIPLKYVEVRPVDFVVPVRKKKMFRSNFCHSRPTFFLLQRDILTCPIFFFFVPTNLRPVLFFFEENKTLCANGVYITYWAVGGKIYVTGGGAAGSEG